MRFRRKLVEVEAQRWFKMGDHPEVSYSGWTEGGKCEQCGAYASVHGLLNGHIVHSGDFIVTETDGTVTPWRPGTFGDTFEVIL